MTDSLHCTSLPTRAFPILPLRKSALFPGTTVRLDVGRPRSLAMVATLSEGAIIGLVPQRDAKVDEPSRADLHDVGTLARVVEIAKASDRAVRLTVEGLERPAGTFSSSRARACPARARWRSPGSSGTS